MLFNSQVFLLAFLPSVLIADFLATRFGGPRFLLLIAFSLLFYAWWYPPYLALLLVSTLVNWTVAQLYWHWKKVWILYVAISLNLIALGWFKYAGLFVGTWSDLMGADMIAPAIVLPLAISFFTFHHIAYLVDLRRNESAPTPLMHYSLFISFFPSLLAGPIVRYREFVPQLSVSHPSDVRMEMAGRGIVLFTIGLAKKVLIADELAGVVNQLYALDSLSFAEAWIAAIGFSLQIYFDFSGYSDMALGLALMLGYQLPRNFESPYKATSLVDFWRRWHMTLSRFLRDYLYIPLGGSRSGLLRLVSALFVTMLLGGLWHGAAWTFVFWGVLHGCALILVHLWRSFGFRMPSLLGWLLTTLFVVGTFVVFRATSMGQALNILGSLLGLDGFKMTLRIVEGGWRPAFFAPVSDALILLLSAAAITWFFPNSNQLTVRARPILEVALALGCLTTVLILLMGQGAQEFVYFQF